jgi:hypothetical protein
MKAKPVRFIYGAGYVDASVEDATHVTLNFPGPVGELTLPVILSGKREGTGCWTWNGDVNKPTLRPSVLTVQDWIGMRCHTWVNDGQAQFLDDCSHELRGKTVDMLEVP